MVDKLDFGVEDLKTVYHVMGEDEFGTIGFTAFVDQLKRTHNRDHSKFLEGNV